jgi:Sodium/hydrogen exchanger family
MPAMHHLSHSAHGHGVFDSAAGALVQPAPRFAPPSNGPHPPWDSVASAGGAAQHLSASGPAAQDAEERLNTELHIFSDDESAPSLAGVYAARHLAATRSARDPARTPSAPAAVARAAWADGEPGEFVRTDMYAARHLDFDGAAHATARPPAPPEPRTVALLRTAVRLGAVFAPTDNSAMLHILSPSAQPVLHSLLFGEGVMNDITAVVLLRAAADVRAATLAEAVHVLVAFARLFLFSALAGVAAGLASALVTKRAPQLPQVVPSNTRARALYVTCCM